MAGENDPHLLVVPADASWGWEIELRRPSERPLAGGPRYPSEEAAREASDFIREMVNNHYPTRFENW